MRKFPIFFLIDVSESMAGEALTQLETGMRTITADLISDPYALETAFLSVIAFAGRPRTLTPLTELTEFIPPHLPVGAGTGLGAALTHLMDEIDRNVTPSSAEQKGDWKPLVFLMTDGVPTDNPTAQVQRWKRNYASRAALVAISIGGGADKAVLNELAEEVLEFDDTAAGSFRKFIGWITNSVKASTRSVTSGGEISLAKLDDNISGKGVNSLPFAKVDDRYAVFVGKCCKSKAPYLVKYEKHLNRMGAQDPRLAELFASRDYLLKTALPVQQDYFELSDGEAASASISWTELIGQPSCPHCQVQFGMAVCSCGGIHCVSGDGAAICPWCGKEGVYGASDGSAGGFEIRRGRG